MCIVLMDEKNELELLAVCNIIAACLYDVNMSFFALQKCCAIPCQARVRQAPYGFID